MTDSIRWFKALADHTSAFDAPLHACKQHPTDLAQQRGRRAGAQCRRGADKRDADKRCRPGRAAALGPKALKTRHGRRELAIGKSRQGGAGVLLPGPSERVDQSRFQRGARAGALSRCGRRVDAAEELAFCLEHGPPGIGVRVVRRRVWSRRKRLRWPGGRRIEPAYRRHRRAERHAIQQTKEEVESKAFHLTRAAGHHCGASPATRR